MPFQAASHSLPLSSLPKTTLSMRSQCGVFAPQPLLGQLRDDAKPCIDVCSPQVPSWCRYSLPPPAPPAGGWPRLQALLFPRLQSRPGRGGRLRLRVRRRRLHHGILRRSVRPHHSAVLPRLAQQLQRRDFALCQFVGHHVAEVLSGCCAPRDVRPSNTFLTLPCRSSTSSTAPRPSQYPTALQKPVRPSRSIDSRRLRRAAPCQRRANGTTRTTRPKGLGSS